MTLASRIDLDLDAPSWETVVSAAAGESEACVQLTKIRHPVLDAAWALPTKQSRKDACWDALLSCRERNPGDATLLVASFVAHDPVRTLPKIAEFRPVALIVAANGETYIPWPTDGQGMRLSGRLVWFVDEVGEIGLLSWPKVATRDLPGSQDLVARAARLAISDQINAFRSADKSTECGLCRQPLSGATHVDHERPFAQLLEAWLAEHGGVDAIATTVVNPPGGDPRLSDEHFSDWCGFHRQRATLRMTHAKCNLKRSRQ